MFDIFLGNQTAYDLVMKAQEGIDAKVAAGTVFETGDGEDDSSHLVDVQAGVAIVSIKGSLTNKDSPWNKFFGVTSYNEIRAAVIEAASKPEVKQIVLDIDSPGGFIAGLSDTAELIANLSKVKPITAFTDGTMYSAAYWLGSHAKKVVASEVAQLGSVGILVVHKEYSKQLEKAGVTATVVRGGKYKALSNPYEPLSAKAKTEMQAKVDHVYGIFVEAVADARGVSYDEADDMSQGREYIGQQAVDAGLADDITSFDKLLAMLQKKAKPKNSPSSFTGTTLRGEAAMKRVVLTPERLAAIEAGAAPTAEEQKALLAASESSEFTEEQIAEIQAKVEAGTALTDEEQAALDAIKAKSENSELSAEEQLEALKAKKEAGETLTDEETATLTAASEAEAGAASGDETSVGTLTAKLSASQEMVALLKTDLTTASQALLKANTQVEQLTTKQEGMDTVHAGFMAITQRSIQKMQIALGGSPAVTDTFTATQLLELHAQVQDEFVKVFKVEGVAISDAEAESTAKTPTAKASALHNAGVGAARLHVVKK